MSRFAEDSINVIKYKKNFSKGQEFLKKHMTNIRESVANPNERKSKRLSTNKRMTIMPMKSKRDNSYINSSMTKRGNKFVSPINPDDRLITEISDIENDNTTKLGDKKSNQYIKFDSMQNESVVTPFPSNLKKYQTSLQDQVGQKTQNDGKKIEKKKSQSMKNNDMDGEDNLIETRYIELEENEKTFEKNHSMPVNQLFQKDNNDIGDMANCMENRSVMSWMNLSSKGTLRRRSIDRDIINASQNSLNINSPDNLKNKNYVTFTRFRLPSVGEGL